MTKYVVVTCAVCGEGFWRPERDASRPLSCGGNCRVELARVNQRAFWDKVKAARA